MGREIVRLNKSARFLLPLVAHHNVFRPMYIQGLINTYIELPNILYIESSIDSKHVWEMTPTLLEIIPTKHNTLLFKCKIPEQYQPDVDNFITGRYSKFSKQAKEIICTRNNGGKRGYEETREYKILYKMPDLKQTLEERLGVKLGTEAELFSIPNMEDELYEEREGVAV